MQAGVPPGHEVQRLQRIDRGRGVTPQTITLNENTLGMVLDTVSTMPHDGSMQVAFRKAKDKRSIAQNALYWGAWLPELKQQTGYTEDELHDRFKKTYMLRIYLADQQNEKQEKWVELYDVIKREGTLDMVNRAVDTLSTTWATVEQFTEYLNRIETFCQSKGFRLPMDIHYQEAMAA
jgi:hypothetical protein